MAVTRVSVINRALQHHGAKRISSVNDTAHSREADSMFDVIRDKELTNNLWAFSIFRAALPTLDGGAVYYYDNVFLLPDNFLRMIEVENHPDYMIENNGILCNEDAPLNIRYVKRVESEGEFSPLFAEVLAASIAYNMTDSVKSSADDKTRMLDAYRDMLGEAVRTNAIELPPVVNAEDEWITARI